MWRQIPPIFHLFIYFFVFVQFASHPTKIVFVTSNPFPLNNDRAPVFSLFVPS